MKAPTTYRFVLSFCAIAMLFGCHEPTGNGHPPYEGPPKDHIITVERAQEMYDTYSQRRVPIIQKYEDSIAADGSKYVPTRFAEFDMETIKQYIAYIEHEAKEAKVDIKTLRFYLSNYPNSDEFPNGDAVKFPKKNSLFVVPTMAYEGKNVGFYLKDVDGVYTALPINRHEGQGAHEPEKEKDQEAPKASLNEAGFFTTNAAAVQGGGTTSVILNDSNIMPPPANEDDFGNN